DLVRAGTGLPTSHQVRRLRTFGIVHGGAKRLVIPRSVVEQLGLHVAGTVQVRQWDGRFEQWDVARRLHLFYKGRDGVFNAVVDPAGTSLKIGAIVLQDLDLVIHWTGLDLVPRDPKQVIAEIE